MKRLPFPTTLSTDIEPLCASQISLQIANPRPVPSPLLTASGVCSKASKIRFLSASAIPGPVSLTEMSMWSSETIQSTAISPPCGVW